MASSFGSDEFAMFAAIFRSSFENTIIDLAVRLPFMSELSGRILMYIKKLSVSTHLSFIVCPDICEYAQILMYIYTNFNVPVRDVYTEILMYIIYMNLGVRTPILMYI